MNQQPVEKQQHRHDGVLDIVRVWDTIQGEGPFAGTPATFIRLAGCNLMCPACDTNYTSNRSLEKPYEILKQVKRLPERDLIVLTGGEPFRQNIYPFIMMLRQEGKHVQIETNGTLHIPGSVAFASTIVCSPKTPKVDITVWDYSSVSVKYVIEHGKVEADGLPSSSLGMNGAPARPPKKWEGRIYVQPMDSGSMEQDRLNVEETVKSSMTHGYLLSLQMHKIVGVD